MRNLRAGGMEGAAALVDEQVIAGAGDRLVRQLTQELERHLEIAGDGSTITGRRADYRWYAEGRNLRHHNTTLARCAPVSGGGL